jgi:hypothetical protein
MKTLRILGLGLSVLVLSACGGSGGLASALGGGEVDQRAGVYRSTYSGGDIVMEISEQSAIKVVVHNGSDTYTGIGTINNVGVVTATASKSNPDGSILLIGTVTGSGATATFNGTASGSISSSFTGTLVSSIANNPFAGNYTGTFGGSSSGTWTGSIAANGTINVTANDGTNTINLNGSTDNLGAGSFTGIGPGGATFTFSGTFRFGTGAVRTASGSWSSTAPGSGVWSGTRN